MGRIIDNLWINGRKAELRYKHFPGCIVPVMHLQKPEPAEDHPEDWMLVSEAVAELPFVGNLKALYRYVEKNPGKLRLRDHPQHKKRRQAHRADVQRLVQEYNEKEFSAMDSPAADDLHAISEVGMEALAARMSRERQKKAGK